jgi:hypothetical protein
MSPHFIIICNVKLLSMCVLNNSIPKLRRPR